MHKLTFKNKFGQIMQVHGIISGIEFLPNEGDPITCTDAEFVSIEKI